MLHIDNPVLYDPDDRVYKYSSLHHDTDGQIREFVVNKQDNDANLS